MVIKRHSTKSSASNTLLNPLSNIHSLIGLNHCGSTLWK